MGNPVGSFIWYELMTGDADAAAAFYGSVVGWKVGANVMPDAGMDYRMIERIDGGSAGCGYSGGVLALTDEMIGGGAKPGWLGYIHVPDVDAEVAAIVAEGGGVHMPATTMEGVGRMAMVTDPLGGAFYLMTPQPPEDDPDATSDVFTVDKPQTIRWNELVTPDDDAAVAFYTKHFGWTQEGAMPMGELGDYRFIQNEGVGIGAVMKKADFMPVAGWAYYIGIDDIDRALAAVKDGGGKAMGDPQQIPGGEYTVHAFDPQGAYFGLVGPKAG
ncbi:VOC family protein [Novosphingobium sp. P6W]|uniref:VOC family protein n=1 Tax=Novosphingobium sp. P6W TaxID=1609758 RepID=UPI0005C2AD87|nr:VOC family protein [Novosphingobium sp. P6W]AXB76870.1 VOC family protein [Novosphingobium sp. P6W]KIS33284.1 glyoxalase [Novosphingobium sp. P6W]